MKTSMMKQLAYLTMVAILAVYLTPVVGMGAEPVNNIYPWINKPDGYEHMYTGDLMVHTLYMENGGYASYSYGGTQSGKNYIEVNDVDYFMLVCGDPESYISVAQLQHVSADGDLDLEVFNTRGAFLGGSYNVTDNEDVYLGFDRYSAVVVKVYGYMGATGRYAPGIQCSKR